MKRTLGLLSAVAAVALGTLTFLSWGNSAQVTASSHREAPLIMSDPEADGTDLYAFVSPDRPDTVTFIMAYNPLQAPDAGPNFYKFGSDVVYRLNIDNTGDAEEDIIYEWRFFDHQRNPNTFLYNTGPVASIDDPNLNFFQTYTLNRWDRGQGWRMLLEHAPVAPVNVGKRGFPDYAAVAAQAVLEVPNTGGAKVFAGPVDDPFWVDLRVFDLLQVAPPGQARDSLAGLNVHAMALQAPISRFTRTGQMPGGGMDPAGVIGVWMTSLRPSIQIFNPDGSQETAGPLVQVSRLGNPLVNEVVVPRGAKDRFNASHPRNDAQFLAGVTDPELARLMNAVLDFPAPTTNRADLVSVFLTGVEGLNMPANVRPAELLRLNLGIPPAAQPSRMGVLGGDTSGFPNGRRLADEVTDIALQAVGGVLLNVPGAETLSQNVPGNDVPFRATFPYLAQPHPGNR